MTENWAPVGIDVHTPSSARMYDYFLGGKDHYASDREAGDQVLEALPEAGFAARSNRAFLQRAVRFLAEQAGIRQFVDIGTGLPTNGNVHEIAQHAAPDARVVYVDNDPIVLTHARALLATDASTAIIEGDLRRPREILANLPGLIDLDEPVAVLTVAIMHFVAEDPAQIVAQFRDAMAGGSYLVLTHATADEAEPEVADRVRAVYGRSTTPLISRTREQIRSVFEGFELVEPGLAYLSEWRPDPEGEPIPEHHFMVGGVGRKPD